MSERGSLTPEQLDEVRHQVAELECVFSGHEYDVVIDLSWKPISVNCPRCRQSWPVGEEQA